MRHERLTDKLTEKAALYALGLLGPEDARDFENHLGAGCAVCENEVSALRESAALVPLSLPEREPSPRVREALLDRIRTPGGRSPQVWKDWSTPIAAALHVVRSQQGEWQFVCEGVTAKQLYADPAHDIVTMLIRMEPGSTYPAHRHGGPEQCFVLEGDVRVGDLVLRAGDYQCANTESVHTVTTTENGCLLLIVSSQHDQLIA